ncbi:MAG: NADPH-dependent assimilatory sulfite reductase hemoprotein subunit [Planctomycetota bacterium]
MAKDKNSPSKVEGYKQESRLLRGTIDEVLRDPEKDHFEESDLQLIKFHGSYQQDDRDLRKERRAAGLGKAYSFMLRIAIPAGQLSASQYLDLDRMADEFANGTIRLTTRQAVQFHGIIKSNLRETLRQINQSLLTTLAACGDVCRNVMATAAPLKDSIHETVRETAHAIAADLRPATKAYYDLWIDGQKELSSMETNDSEPFYGETYLPRKFKAGVTVANDNQIDIYSYDAGLIGVIENEELVGWNVLAGGGLGMSHGRPNTFAQIADKIGFVAIEKGVDAIRVIASIYRDFGNRNDRKQARLKYLIDTMGLDQFKTEFRKRCLFQVQNWREIPAVTINDWMGQHEQGDGKFFYGVFVENGRVKDSESIKMRTALRQIAEELGCGIVVTAQQSLIFQDLDAAQVDRVKEILSTNNVPLVETLSNARRYSMACPSMPTCGLAVAESERVAPEIITSIENKLEELGLSDSVMTIRMTGCPNGCARPYTADLALVGRRPGVYHLFVGGRLAGDRMADLYAADVKVEALLETLTPLLTSYAELRKEGEGLGDFYQRTLERSEPRRRVTGKEVPTYDEVQPKLYQLGAR